MKLLTYTIGGQKIGIDIQTWNENMLSGNTAFLAIADTGSTPTDYVDVSSTANWDKFGGITTLTSVEIKAEIIKLIPNVPTAEEYEILEGYINIGLNSMTNIDNNLTLGSVLTDGQLSGVTDTKFSLSGGTVDGSIETTGSIAGVSGTLNVGGNINVGGSSATGGNSTIGGNSAIGGNSTVTGSNTTGGDLIIIEKITGTSATFSQNMNIDGQLTINYVEQINTTQEQIRLRHNSFAPVFSFSGLAMMNADGAGNNFLMGINNSGVMVGGWSGSTLQSIATGSSTGSSTLTTYSVTNPTTITTISTSDVLMTGIEINSVPAGNYFLSFGTSLGHSSTSDNIYTNIYVGGVAVTGSEQHWRRGGSQGNVVSTHNYSGFPITLATTATIEIRWRTDSATASAENPYMTLIKVG